MTYASYLYLLVITECSDVSPPVCVFVVSHIKCIEETGLAQTAVVSVVYPININKMDKITFYLKIESNCNMFLYTILGVT